MKQQLDQNYLQDDDDGLTTVISSAQDEDVIVANGMDPYGTINGISDSPRDTYSSSPGRINPEKRKKTSQNRRPFHYPVDRHGSIISDADVGTAATYSRYRYYSRLTHPEDRTLEIPEHIIPASFFSILPQNKKQSSIVTIFSIWNTMLGTSLLSMPWALGQAGFVLGILLMLFMAGLTLYTCYRIMKSTDGIEVQGDILEFSDVCRQYLGRWGEYCSVFFSLSALLGALIVYWVLLSNFLYNTVNFIYDNVNHLNMNMSEPTNDDDAVCHYTGHHSNSDNTPYEKVWNPTHTVPLFLILVLFPLINIKSPTFFTKFNALGTISVIYLISFVTYYGAHWKINLDFSLDPLASVHFPALTGTLALAYFIHSCILSILRNQSQPKNNGRDLTVAYVLVAVTYILVGFLFYASVPCDKKDIQDNFLNNFTITNPAAFVARLCLFFQMVTVFPLIVYIFRIQIFHTLFSNSFPGMKHVLALNVVIVGICLSFAILLPQIGTIIRFSGAFCGLAYVFTLPCLVYLCAEKEKGTLTAPKIIIHTIIILIGVANFVGQFLIF